MKSFLTEANGLFDYTCSVRRNIHENPELGFHEYRTSQFIVEELKKLPVKVQSGIAETGVVGIIEGAKPGPVILLRFDIDALPIQEETGAVYASKTSGVMHACGHDAHIATGLTVAKILCNHKNEFNGTVKLMFQPAEEGDGGARRMVEEGVLKDPTPECALTLHVWNEKPVGWVGIRPGPVMAGSSRFFVRITGKGGHGAVPNASIDPVLASAQIVTALQSIVSRNVSPLQQAVLSVTSIQTGQAFNVIPQVAEIKGTVRTFEKNVQEVVEQRFEKIVKGVAEAMGCTAVIQFVQTTSPVTNDPKITEIVKNVAQRDLPSLTLEQNYQTMGSEDMSEVMDVIPGCYFFVGTANSEKGLNFGHHHPKFDIDEAALPAGIALMVGAAFEYLGK